MPTIGTNRNRAGFTIVELLIVIIVIAILATISIVAYNGIQNRAHDTAIQNDLNNFAKKIHLAAALTGEFPAGGATYPTGGNSTTMIDFTFKPSKRSYLDTVNNLYYCTGIKTDSGEAVFRVGAKSRSNNMFVYSSDGGMENKGNVIVNSNVLCSGVSPATWGYGYNPGPTYGWFGWTNG